MSTVKLTLSIPERLLAEAKAYAIKAGQPLSQLVSRYFAILSGQEKEASISPRVRRITGIAKGSKADDELLTEALKGKYHLARGSR